MKERYFQLSADDQRDILTAAESSIGISAKMLEKDIWICWVLEQLFSNFEGMVFKGGTSLSKGYDVIQRFSEDIDITINPLNLGEKINVDKITNAQAKKVRNRLRDSLVIYLRDKIAPFLRGQLSKQFDPKDFQVKLIEEKESIEFCYASVLVEDFRGAYLLDHILLEFGSRNSIEPNKDQELTCLTEGVTDNIELPRSQVKMLSIVRTFWEKATLIHVECNRTKLERNPNRMSRHWYDLVKIMDSKYYNDCIKDKDVFYSVLKYKEKFYNSSSANYPACRHGNLRLVPHNENSEGLKCDYKEMVESGMIYGDVPSYDQLTEKILELEKQLNERIKSFV